MSIHALIPCAGSGARMPGDVPKQYRIVAGASVLAHTVRAFLRCARVDSVCVVVQPDDAHARLAVGDDPRVRIVPAGGPSRAASVAGGLAWLRDAGADADDWVLVHDAARCCITPDAIARLVETCVDDPVGGLLALALPDTLKRADGADRVESTVPREGLWLAQTPQMFRLDRLRDALRLAPAVTDEASAIEAAGLRPRLVQGSSSNFKVTYADDLEVAAAILGARQGR